MFFIPLISATTKLYTELTTLKGETQTHLVFCGLGFWVHPYSFTWNVKPTVYSSKAFSQKTPLEEGAC